MAYGERLAALDERVRVVLEAKPRLERGDGLIRLTSDIVQK